jgi:hypothetical protein
MFNFIKKMNLNSNRNNRHRDAIEALSVDYNTYMKQVEGGILPYWIDKEFQTKTGVKDLFADGARVQNVNMSYDDAFDCLKRIARMINMATYVTSTFGERSDALPREGLRAIDNNNFYSANTIRDLFIEAGSREYVYGDVVPDNAQDAINSINVCLSSFKMIKRNVFFTAVTTAQVALCTMKGFVK